MSEYIMPPFEEITMDKFKKSIGYDSREPWYNPVSFVGPYFKNGKTVGEKDCFNLVKNYWNQKPSDSAPIGYKFYRDGSYCATNYALTDERLSVSSTKKSDSKDLFPAGTKVFVPAENSKLFVVAIPFAEFGWLLFLFAKRNDVSIPFAGVDKIIASMTVGDLIA